MVDRLPPEAAISSQLGDVTSYISQIYGKNLTAEQEGLENKLALK